MTQCIRKVSLMYVFSFVALVVVVVGQVDLPSLYANSCAAR